MCFHILLISALFWTQASPPVVDGSTPPEVPAAPVTSTLTRETWWQADPFERARYCDRGRGNSIF